MNLLNYLRRPEYVFRPRQVLHRFRRCWKPADVVEAVHLPWGAQVFVRPHENIGSDIYHYGVFDLVVPEAIFRLLDRGELAIDVGANIGQNTSLMARRVGPTGSVMAFEPHPEIFLELTKHVGLWQATPTAPIQVENVALGDEPGQAALLDGLDFNTNRGSAFLSRDARSDGVGHIVSIRTLDDYLGQDRIAGVCKVDVEGHELDVFRGATRTLARRGIRDIIYEDFNMQPSAVTNLLTSAGYSVFGLLRTWLKPVLLPAGTAPAQRAFSHNYVATLDPERLKARFAPRGWRCLYRNV